MANKNALNKNSLYVQSLVDFILDTKPYHVKLTEIVEEYRFFDDVRVGIKERFSSKTKIDSTWMYNYFSSANPLYRTMPAQRVTSPAFLVETHVVGRDENTDLALVPFAYSKKSFQGPGVNAVYVRRGEFTEALTESVDYFQSHGSFQFQVKQVRNANGDLDPLWATTPDDDVILEARRQTRAQALDLTNPNSAINRIRALLDEISAAVASVGGHADVERELQTLYAVLDRGDLPGRENWTSQYDPTVEVTYAALFAWLAVPNEQDVVVPLEAPKDREWYEQQLSRYASPLFFGMFTDMGVRESGRVEYGNQHSAFLHVTNLKVRGGRDIEEWEFRTVPGNAATYTVTGSTTGFVGFIVPSDESVQHFDNGSLSFDFKKPLVSIGDDLLVVSPTRKVVIGDGAPLETWNVIKVNPIAHDRPEFVSTRFGHIRDLDGKVGSVSILSRDVPTEDIVLTSRGDGRHFDLTSASDPSYSAVATVGTPFNDGKIGFTIVRGTGDFPKGDRFLVSIENLPARAENLDLGYGYDMDPYDDDDMATYPDTGKPVGFYYDGRFTDYDLSSMGLQVTDAAIDGRKWRMRAVPDYLRPIDTVPTPGFPTPRDDLRVYYADTFILEYSDDDFLTKREVTRIAQGASFSSAEHGISFRIAPASRPFVAVSAVDGADRIEGGDVFSFEISNPEPRLVETPVGLSTSKMPRLIMHSDSFFTTPAATWTVEFSDAGTYTVSGSSGDVAYGPVECKVPTSGQVPREGYSFRGLGVHFTIVPVGPFAAGEKFTFNTFAEKPSYLVHGSVTGWTKPATVGEYYWNGKIGFKIRAPEARTYVGGRLVADLGDFEIREDCPSLVYTFVKNAAGYQVTRSDTGESGFGGATFQDKYLTFDLTGVTEQEFQLAVDAHDYPLWNTADVVIINPKAKSRLPRPGDVVAVEKTEEGRLSLNLVPSLVNVSALAPVTIDQRFIDTNTHGAVPLAATSPETMVLQGWVPLSVERMDSQTSPAEFSDPATRYSVRAAANNQQVGVLTDNVFEWDAGFYAQYLPLNAEANLLVQGTGWDDRVSARITESIKFLLGGGATTEDWMFQDRMEIQIRDENFFNIVQRYNDDIAALVDDGPFGGFLPGYANVPYDGVSPYDQVVPALPAAPLPPGAQFYNESNSTLYTMTEDGWDAGEFIPQATTAPAGGSSYFNPVTKQLFRKT